MTNAPETSRKERLLAHLAMHIGSECVFRHWSRRLVYTEGVQCLAQEAEAYWLIDLIASYVPHPKMREQAFVVWKLTVNASRTALAVADDGNGKEILRQEIAFTDFPLDEITLYLTDNTLLLPTEY
jgi:hypothetical protein